MKTLFNFQTNAINYLKDKDRALLALDMGLGKTFTALKWWEQKENGIPITLFILCQKNKIEDWFNEVKDIFPTRRILMISTLANFGKWLIEAQSGDVVILNYTIFSLYSKKNIRWWLKLKMNHGLIFDESQGLRNRQTLISTNVLRWSKTLQWILLLSGDPIPNGYQDIYQQMKILGLWPEKNKPFTWHDFIYHFCKARVIPGTSVLSIYGYKNVEGILELLKPNSYFLMTKDAVDLPDTWFIEHKGECSKEYYEFKVNQILEIGDYYHVSRGTLSQMTSLRQIASGFLKDQNLEEPNYFKLNTHKLNLLDQVLNEMPLQPVVIFHNYTFEKELIKEALKHRYIIEINGTVNTFNALQDYPTNTIFLIQYQAGAKGIDGLQNFSRRIIYYSPTLSGELFKQSIKRIHRIGQSNKCIYHLLVNSPLEVHIYKSLRLYQDFTIEMFKELKD